MNKKSVSKRSQSIISITDCILGTGLDLLSNTHIEMPTETNELIQKNTNITYIGLHKSSWETLAILHAIKGQGGAVPYVVMGEGIIKNKIILYLMKKAGVITVNREGPKKETALGLLEKITDVLEHKDSLLIFPEGRKSRTGEPEKFKTTVFQGVVQATRTEPQYIVSVNVDYSQVIEENDYQYPIGKVPKRPIRNTLRWFKHIGNTYISFSRPVLIAEGYDRKSLTEKIWTDALDLIKIQPINIVSTVLEKYLEKNADSIHCDNDIVSEEIYKGIDELMHDLEQHKDKFRDFKITDDAVPIAQRAGVPFSLTKKNIYKLYAGYTRQYTSK
jgi:1-acyl-sn-glycerol-3-phosphate acyltransferase